MDHIADDRSRADDCDLHDDIVEVVGTHSRQARHLCAALDLKHADRVGLLHGSIRSGIILRQMREIDLFAIVSANQLQRIFQHCHHSKAEEVHLHNSHVCAIVFVPLHDSATGHCRRFQRNHRIQLSLANHHAAGMLSEMPW